MIKPFSVRYGHVDVREHVQLNDLNSDTRMALWNCLYLSFGLTIVKLLQQQNVRSLCGYII